MEVPKSTVCVIGAGLSGLVTVKCFLDAGLQVTCLEKENAIAGRWNPNSEHPIPESTITNLPHFLSGFSDFPVPDNFPLYLPADVYHTYFQMYAERFNLLPHIKLGCRVTKAVQQVRFNTSVNGQPFWKINYQTNEHLEIEEEFDYLVVCSGFYQEAFVPKPLIEAISGFKGSVLHALDYKSWRGFEGKKVLVCGLGNTGGDIAVELSHHARTVYLSTSRGANVIGRMFNGGDIPVAKSLNRFSHFIPDLVKPYFVRKIANYVYNLTELRLASSSKSLGSVVGGTIVNDELCMRVAAGKVAVRSGVQRVVDKTIYFADGTMADDVDVIIMCTGYKRVFPFFDETLLHIKENGKYLPLYKGVFYPGLQNVAFVGMFSVAGAVALVSEMQARYAASVFRGSIKLPKREVMEDYIEACEQILKAHGDIKEYNLILDPWRYYDELAKDIGCSRPSLISLLFSDPLLAWNLCTTYSPHEYRLVGPNKWEGARDAILREQERRYAFMDGSRKV